MFKVQKLDLLVGLYITCILFAEIMGGKTFPLFRIGSYPLNASVAILVLPIIFSINDIVTEVYGPERARSIVRTGLIMVILLFLFSLLVTSLPPSQRFLATEKAYDVIFQTTARISFASLIAFTVANFTDVFIFSRLRKHMQNKALWVRNNVSNIISQLLDTTLFITLAFYAFDRPFWSNALFLSGIILPYWLLKCFMSIIETPFVYLGVKWLEVDSKTSSSEMEKKEKKMYKTSLQKSIKNTKKKRVT